MMRMAKVSYAGYYFFDNFPAKKLSDLEELVQEIGLIKCHDTLVGNESIDKDSLKDSPVKPSRSWEEYIKLEDIPKFTMCVFYRPYTDYPLQIQMSGEPEDLSHRQEPIKQILKRFIALTPDSTICDEGCRPYDMSEFL
jgi:hypothetical protein